MSSSIPFRIAGALGNALDAAGSAAGSLKQFFLWQVAGQLVSAALAPALADIQQAAFSTDANLTLSPEQLAVGSLRGLLDPGNSESEAAKSGIGPGRFAQLKLLAGSPPSLEYLIAGYQRAVLGSGSADAYGVDFEATLTDLGIAAKYHALIRGLAVQIPSAQAVMEALLEGQIDEDEARSRYAAAGGDPDWFQTDYNRQGQAPTPVEALEMLNRGLIEQDGTGPDSTSWEQAFLEGPWRNKWASAFLGLRYYVTPPRSVVAQLRAGAITEAEAAAYLAEAGVKPATAAQFIKEATHTATAAARELSQAQVVAAYEAKLITAAEATADLVALKYSASNAALLLALADKKQATSAAHAAVTRIQTLYLSGKDTAATATTALRSLGLDDGAVSALLATWDLERTTTTRTLTEAQIVAAVFYGAMTVETGVARLMALGYDNQDANILIINRTHELPAGWVVV